MATLSKKVPLPSIGWHPSVTTNVTVWLRRSTSTPGEGTCRGLTDLVQYIFLWRAVDAVQLTKVLDHHIWN